MQDVQEQRWQLGVYQRSNVCTLLLWLVYGSWLTFSAQALQEYQKWDARQSAYAAAHPSYTLAGY